MTQFVLSNPSIRVNNITAGFMPNSLTVKLGKGENSVKGVSIGGGLSDVAVSEDVEDRVAMVKFTLYTTNDNIELFNNWKTQELTIGNDIKIFDRTFNATMRNGIVINDPEIAFGVDKEFEVEFRGPMIVEFS